MAVLGGASGVGCVTHGPERTRRRVGLGDALRLLPPVDRVTLTQWYRASDAVLVPSHSESFGLVAVEARATGALVAASEVGDLPVAIGDAGLLLPVGDVAAWADALEPLLVEPGAATDLRARAPSMRVNSVGMQRSTSFKPCIKQPSSARASPRSTRSEALVGIPSAVIP